MDVIGRGRRIRYDKRFAKRHQRQFRQGSRSRAYRRPHLRTRRGGRKPRLPARESTAAALVTPPSRPQPSVTAFRIDVRGGRLGIAFDEPKPGIYTRIRLSGEARKVFEGSYDTANFQS